MEKLDTLVVLVHGFANPAGKHTTKKLKAGFEALGCDVESWDYWWHSGWYSFLPSLIQVRLANKAIGYGLRRYLLVQSLRYKHIVCIGHSNGAAIIWIASQSWKDENGKEWPGAKMDSVVLLNPALDVDRAFGERVEQISCIHTPFDIPTRVSEAFLLHWWGRAGAEGFKINDPRVVNIDSSTHKDFPIRTHSGIMEDENLKGYWEKEIQRLSIGGWIQLSA